ncbi:hypothetical protein [Ottowia testudinis]|nr:hypothetical protein [Ottowia testudinis]
MARMLRLLRNELEMAMASSGCTLARMFHRDHVFAGRFLLEAPF